MLAGDLGGTKCRFALVGDDFSVHFVRRVETVRERAPFLAAFDSAVREILADADRAGLPRPLAAGFGTAGVVTKDGSAITYAPNLPLDGFPLATHVADRFGFRTALLNDGRASAWGEYLRGHAAGRDPLLCLFFGTGIGIGLIADGQPFDGADSAAGEIGHTTFRPGGRACPCGRAGHFEAYCGGRAINELAAEQIAPLPPDGSGRWHTGAVLALAKGDDAAAVAARTILADAELAACTLVENACTLLNPRAVVLGGGVLSGWPELGKSIEQHVRTHTSVPVHQHLEFVPSLGGSDAILWGAAAATRALWPRG